MTIKTIEFSLKKEGHEVLKAYDGEQAIRLLDEQQTDLVITDINVPYTKGLELVRYVNTRLPARVPVIIISGINLEETKEHARELGAAGYLTKPFDPGELLKMVHSVTGDKPVRS